jgi:hypothetical protein
MTWETTFGGDLAGGGESEGVGDVGAYVVAGDAQGDAGEVHVEQGQFAGAEMVARRLADPFRAQGLDGQSELIDAAGGLDGDVVALGDRVQGFGGGGTESARQGAVFGVGVDVEHLGGAEGAGDVAHVEADAAAGDDRDACSGAGPEVGAARRQARDQLSLAEAMATGSRPAGSGTSMASA